jgi:RNA polymerase sigma factor FliA
VSDRPRRALTPEQQAYAARFQPLAERQCGGFLRQTRAHYLASDLRSAALQALHEAALAYDPTRGVPFEAFAWRRIDGALSDTLKQESKHWREAREDSYDAAEAVEDTSQPLADSEAETTAQVDGMGDEVAAAAVLGLVGRVLRAQGEEGEERRAAYRKAIRAVESALSRLPDGDRSVLVRHYFDRQTWQELGRGLGCSERTAKRRGAEARGRFALALRAGQERAQGEAVDPGQMGSPGAAAG